MKNFRQWLEELSDEETETVRSYGYVFLDEIETRTMKMVLLEAPHFPPKFRYHLAFQRIDKSAFNIKQQFTRDNDKKTNNLKIGIVDGFNTIKPLMQKLVEWLTKYPIIVIASHNEILTSKWLANLTIAARYLEIPIVIETESLMGTIIYLIKLS